MLTSRSEGLPLVLMEAMGRGRIVLAPAITGIPELVMQGRTGFLYQAGSMDDFVRCLCFIHSQLRAEEPSIPDQRLGSTGKILDWVRFGAQVQVRHNFSRKKNLERFADLLLTRLSPQAESVTHEDFVLQQI